MLIHQSFTENRRDLLYRTQCFNTIDCESWRNDVRRERHLPDGELRGNDMIEARGLFLLDQVFEDADIFGLQNFDSEELIRLLIDSEKETVEREKLRRIGSCDRPVHF